MKEAHIPKPTCCFALCLWSSASLALKKHAGVLFFPCLTGEDVWSYAKKLPHLFQQGGVFYNIVKKDMGKCHIKKLDWT